MNKKIKNDPFFIERFFVSLIYYGYIELNSLLNLIKNKKNNKIDMENFIIKGDLFQINEFKDYLKFFVKNKGDLSKTNEEVLYKYPNFTNLLLSKDDVHFHFEKIDLNLVLKILFKKYVERLIQKKINGEDEIFIGKKVDINLAIDELYSLLMYLNDKKNEEDSKYISAISKYKEYMINTINEISCNNGIIGISSGIPELDMITKGFKKKEYTIIAARPSMGKTSLILDFIKNFVINGKRVLFYSLEMPKEQIIGRMLAKINPLLTLENTLYFKDIDVLEAEISQSLNLIEKYDLYIEDFLENDTPLITIDYIKRDLDHKIKTIGNFDVILLDYIQMVKEYKANEMETLTKVSNELKKIAKQYNVPVIALSQLNRNLENRTNKKPTTADLKGSGSLEQDADMIIFPYRPNIYLIHDLEDKLRKKPDNQDLKDKLMILESARIEPAEIIVGKNRNGPTGIAHVNFIKNKASFVSSQSNINNEQSDNNSMINDMDFSDINKNF